VPGYSASEKTFTSPDDLFAQINRENGIDIDFNLQANAAVISGKVYDIQTLMSMEKVTVILIANGTVQQTTNTDPSGIYKFSNLTSNTDYTIRVDTKGYFWDNKNVHVTSGTQRYEYNKTNGHDLDFALQKFEIGKEIIITDIAFQEDKPNILTESYNELDRLANMFIQNPHCVILLRGHVDVTYKAATAKNLSQYRANAVKDYLLSKKVNPSQLVTPQGVGSQSPLVRNPVSTDEHQLNNRITYTVTKIDAAKELEYSRLPVAQTNPQTVTSTVPTQQTTTPATSSPTKPVTVPAQTQYQQVTQPQQPAQSQSSNGFVALNDGAYVVQVASSSSLDLKQADFAKITTQLGLEVKYKLVDGKYKYFVGFFSTSPEAKNVVNELKKIGIKDAFQRSKY
jgi:outer membrane protein OmpA-like peptidoglycan-associated protein